MGFLWLLGGGMATLWSVIALFDSSASINIQGVPSTNPSIKLLGVVVSFLVALFGWFFVRIPPYYPPKIREWMRDDLSHSSPAK